MTSRIKIKLKEVKNGQVVCTVRTAGDPDVIMNGLLDALYQMCKEHNVVMEDVVKVFLNFEKQYVEK